MEFKSIADVLQFAISKEQAAEQFYTDLSAQMHDVATQSIFEAIAKQEKKHTETLRLEMIKAGYTVADSGEPADSDTTYEWQERLELDAVARDMTYVDALMLAIQKERASFQLYAQLVGMAGDMELRKILLELAEEEMRHVLQFEREYETLTHRT